MKTFYKGVLVALCAIGGIAAHYDYKSSLEHISPFHAANIDAFIYRVR